MSNCDDILEQLMAASGEEAWTPPQLASLVGAWVSGLSGPVAKLGTWPGQYGTTRAATLVSDALVSSANGLELVTTGDYATAGATSMGNARGLFSVACWYQRRGTTFGATYPAVFANVAAPASYCGLMASGTTDGFTHNVIAARSQTTSNYVRFDTPTIGDWLHYAQTYDGTTIRGYLNGAEIGTGVTSTVSLSVSTGTLLIGLRSSDYLNAYVDDLYAWDGVALSAAEVASLYTADPYRRGNL